MVVFSQCYPILWVAGSILRLSNLIWSSSSRIILARAMNIRTSTTVCTYPLCNTPNSSYAVVHWSSSNMGCTQNVIPTQYILVFAGVNQCKRTVENYFWQLMPKSHLFKPGCAKTNIGNEPCTHAVLPPIYARFEPIKVEAWIFDEPEYCVMPFLRA